MGGWGGGGGGGGGGRGKSQKNINLLSIELAKRRLGVTPFEKGCKFLAVGMTSLEDGFVHLKSSHHTFSNSLSTIHSTPWNNNSSDSIRNSQRLRKFLRHSDLWWNYNFLTNYGVYNGSLLIASFSASVSFLAINKECPYPQDTLWMYAPSNVFTSCAVVEDFCLCSPYPCEKRQKHLR